MVLLLNYSLQSKNHSPPWGKTLCTDAPPPLAAKGSQKSDFFSETSRKIAYFWPFSAARRKFCLFPSPIPPWQNFLPPLLRDQNPFPPLADGRLSPPRPPTPRPRMICIHEKWGDTRELNDGLELPSIPLYLIALGVVVQDIVATDHHPRASNGITVVEEMVWGFLSLEA